MPQLKREYSCWDEVKKENTILFLDPPYADFHLIEELFNSIELEKWFKGTLWIESDQQKGLPLSYWEDKEIEIAKTFKQGDSYIIVIEFS